MKKINFICLFLIIFFITHINCNASVNTYTRTNDNLLVPNDVVVDSNNIKDILNTPAVSNKEKLYDYADLFTDSQEDSLYDQINDYIKCSSIDLVIVTVNDLNGYSISDYAYNFYDYNDFLEDGVIFIIYKSDNEPEIFMGNSGLPGSKVFTIYSDIRIGQILEYIYNDSLRDEDYYTGVSNYIKILKGFSEKEDAAYGINSQGKIIKHIPWIEIIIIAGALTFVTIMILFYRIKSNNKNSYFDYLEGRLDSNTLIVRKDSEELIDTVVTKDKDR